VKKRQVYFHIGLAKAGSSALQEYLSVNAATLADHGVFYPYPEDRETISSGFCSGNLVHMLQRQATKDNNAAVSPTLSQAYLEPIVQMGLAATDHAKVVFSSETIAGSTAGASLKSTVNFFESLTSDFEVSIIAFVRDAYDQTMSGWKQGIKVGKHRQSFGDFVMERIEKNSFAIENLQPFISAGLDLRLINYDVHRKDIFSVLLREIGAEQALPQLCKLANRPSNPSLSYWQAMQVVMANKHIGSSLLNASLAKRFRGETDNRPDPYFREVDRMILDHLSKPIERLNALLPTGEKLRNTVRASESDDKAGNGLSIEGMVSFMEVVAEVLDLERNRGPVKPQVGLPADFDPLVYLLLNPDVDEADADPVQHYVNHGRFERRSYS
jgi:hypothetical protein